ncbi:glutamate 5-kinase [Natronospora cellulosivora (SeqCode)]
MKKKLYKRIVVKIGSSSLTHDGGKLSLARIDQFLRQMVDLKNQGRDILFVSSGAIAAGMAEFALKERPQSIPEQQGMAAIGQAQLMTLYNKFLREYSTIGAQILLTSSDLEDRHRYLNAYNTMESLLKNGVMPIINENDTIATQEIKFGDNDTLSARVAGLMEADLLIVLSDIEGLYNGDPRVEKNLEVIRKIESINKEIEDLAGGRGSNLGTGGMQTKIEAAKIAVNSGITMVIGPGQRNNILLNIVDMLEKEDKYTFGTTFLPKKESLSKRKHWLLYNPLVCGSIKVDQGAANALLERGKSLLPGGIIEVIGDFQENDPVSIVNINNEVIGKGLVNYSSNDIYRIKGHHSEEINSILGHNNRSDVIHRDNMVIKGSKNSKGGE